ncbi:hypothetical protein BGX27_005270 [Mortierella sp. AM989]|nr:hypothetical protein BGX27_005270 [Mortierella sp. AM989]
MDPVLQRHSDKLLGEIEGAQRSLQPEEEALRSEQCQQALDVRRQVWESSKSLKDALKHVEDIEDEDEPRILRGHMDTLQVHIKEGLKIASDTETKPPPVRKHEEESGKTTATATESKSESLKALPMAVEPSSRNPTGITSQGTSTLAGSWNRHHVGLFSTSPAKSPFIAPVRSPVPRFSSATKASSDSPSVVTGPLGPPSDPLNSSSILAPKATSVQSSRSALIAVIDDPLSMGVMAPVPEKPSARDSRIDRHHVAASPPASSTVKVSPLSEPSLPPAKSVAGSSSATSNLSTAQEATSKDSVVLKIHDPPMNPPQRRRVPRGLFSSESLSGPEPTRDIIPGPGNDLTSSISINHSVSRGLSEGSSSRRENGGNRDASTILKETGSEVGDLNAFYSSGGGEGGIGSSSQSSSSQPQSPLSPITSSFSSPSASGLKSPASPLPRSQPKPSPIQTSNINSTSRSVIGGGNSRGQYDNDEEISQLAKDLERAMNPTPTEPVPQPYFLQGEGLLQRIPSQVSMDDGLLNDEMEDGQRSEDSDEAQELQGEESSLSRSGSGSLHRQKSGGRRRFRIARSRSRNRSKSRLENRNKPALMPIEVGYPSVLASSEWPFEIISENPTSSGPRGRSTTSVSTTTLTPRTQRGQASTFSVRSQQWQPRAGPRLPFAESVSIGNPTRVGKGIGSFTVYSISLKLCDPAKAVLQPVPDPKVIRVNNSVSGSEDTHMQHADSESNRQDSQHDNNRSAEQMSESERVEGTSEHERLHLSKAPSKAALLLTKSFSSPDLISSAERLLMSIQSPDGLSQGPVAASTFACSTSHPSGESTTTTTSTPITHSESEIPAIPESERTIHVLKRYTDFVTLRAQLVELLKNQSRNGGNGRGRQLLSRSTSMNNVTASSSTNLPSGVPERPSRYSEEIANVEGYEDDDDEDEAFSTSHSRAASGASVTSSFTNILRGMPKLPPKKVVGKFRPAFVEKRRRELEYFLEWVVAHPTIGDCPVVVQWFLEDQY